MILVPGSPLEPEAIFDPATRRYHYAGEYPHHQKALRGRLDLKQAKSPGPGRPSALSTGDGASLFCSPSESRIVQSS
jgi:hypothetical protein